MSKWNLTHPVRVKEMQRKYYDANTVLVKERAKQWAAANPEKRKEIMRKWHLAHPGRAAELLKKWRITNPERAKKLSRKVSPTWKRNHSDQVNEFNHRYRARKRNAEISDCTERIEELRTCELCFWCGIRMESVTIDHVIPLSRGGKHTPDNLVAACNTCNSSKYNKLVSEWKPMEALDVSPLKSWT